MDEEIIIGPVEEVVQVDFREIVESEVEPVGIEKVIEAEETVKSVEVELAEDIDIEMDEAVGWIGGDSTRHYSLYGREEPNQHPIEAITGLRNELDEIEALKVVYSNEKNQANYYLWQDENAAQENRVGYFVAVSADVNKVKICTENDDIFGVVVNTAAFIGGQSDLARDYKYALVAHNGVVAVRCESDVNVGDTVIANNYGYARKSDSGYGYKVIELQEIHGATFATIHLDISANQVDALMQTIGGLDERMTSAEINVTSAINIANRAYDKANEINEVSEDAIQKALEALDKSNVATDTVNKMEETVSSANQVAVEARAIAESAVTSAEAMKNEAVAKSNEALTEASNTKKEVENKIEAINSDVNSTLEELYRTQEELTVTRDNLSSDIQDTKDSIASMEEDLVPLAEWTDGERSGIAGFVANADENSATLGSLVKWQGETNTAIAGFKKEVGDTYATIESVNAFKTATTESISAITQRTDANESNIETLTSWQDEAKKTIAATETKANANEASIKNLTSWQDEANESIAEVQQKADANESAINSLTTWKNGATTSIANIEQKANANESSIKTLTAWQGETNTAIANVTQTANSNASSIKSLTEWKNGAVTSIANVEQKADANESKINSLTTWQGEAKKAITSVEQKVDANESKISTLTTWQGETNTSIANIQQKADANGVSLQFLTANIDKYSVGEYSQAYGLTLEQAKSNLEKDMIYVPTVNHSETYEGTLTQTFTQGYYYTWDGTKWVESSSPLVTFSNSYVAGSTTVPYWYIHGDADVTYNAVVYEAKTLYMWQKDKWIAVATLAGNVASRKMTLIRQTQDGFSASVTDLQNNYAGLNGRLTETEAQANMVAEWKGSVESDVSKIANIEAKANDASTSVAMVVSEKDGEKVINTASIVTAINNGESSVVIEGDHIVLNGATTNGNGTFKISADGHMTATGGDIGGFTIGTKSIYNTKTAYNNSTAGVYLGTDGIGLGAGKFYVTKAGELTCTSGSIGGWTISGNSLYKGTNSMTSKTVGTYISTDGIRQYQNDNAYVNIEDGVITAFGAKIKGEITATGGTFTNCSIGKTCKIDGSLISGGLVSKNILNWIESGVQSDTPSYGYIVYNNELEYASYDGSFSSGNGWEIHNRGDDEYMRSWLSFNHYSGNGGSENDAYQIELGTMVHPRYSEEDDYYYYGLSIDNGNIETASLSSAFRAKKDMIISATELTLGSPNGFLTGFWEAANPITVLSDVNAKNSIETMPNAYSTFFDNLKPVIYKYNEGTSNRYHTGFIAQDVKSALDIAGINTVDFAGLCIPVDSSQAWTLRYEEFVSLNTYEIQKLKAEVKELKAQLEELINKN